MNTERQEEALLDYHDKLMNYVKPAMIDELIEAACVAVSIDPLIFRARFRKREVVYARRLVSVYLKINTNKTLVDIGKLTGGRDHASVLHDFRFHQSCVDVKDSYWLESEKNFLKHIKSYGSDYSTNMRFTKKDKKFKHIKLTR